MECKNCPYNYKDEDDRYERCHFVDLRGEPSWLDVPPCEEDDYEDEEYFEEEEYEYL